VDNARLAQAEGVDVFCVGVELNSMERYTDSWQALIARVRQVFTGQIAFSQSTHHYLRGDNLYSSETRFERNVGTFWDACDVIEMNCYPFGLQDLPVDQELGALVEDFVKTWATAVEYYRSRYPGKALVFGEIGTNYANGTTRYGTGGGVIPETMDVQEYVDTWASYLIGAQALGVDGFTAWVVRITPKEQRQQWLRPSEYAANYSHAIKTLASFLK
jgi:hypothetical protein